ncbi:2-amino-4-hydroxy-6-hydroxymethyldihydropteridine diphosphokinase [Tropicimonas sp. S265A]|uniref:2-amino-4-hydroxy-6- hydroxymethyldihydropteridine diphosphokinase n=1 Tax=Tropicimonas sp. S265A TaxID=3415134 RepID=UPI003C7D631D
MLTIGLIALGANLPSGDNPPRVTLGKALNYLFNDKVLEISRSSFYETPAFPDPSARPYVNSCVCLQTSLSAKALLKHLHSVEDRLGRVRDERWGARVIDLDLLSFGAAVVPDRATYDQWADLSRTDQLARTPDELILPHPRIADRSFVLVPLAEIAPLWQHPVTGLTVRQMLDRRSKAEIDAIRPIRTANSGCQD